MTDQTASPDGSTRTQLPADPAVSVVASADVLATALDALDALVDECVVRVDGDGLHVDAMDPATVGMVSLTLDREAFEAYEAPDGDLRLGVPIDRLQDVVGIADADQPIHLAFDAETRMLHVRVGELAYTLALIDPDAIRSPPDRIDLAEQYSASASLDGAGFARAVDAAEMVADHLALGTEDDLLYVRAEGDTDSVEVEFDREDCASLDDGPAHSLFSLQYLASVNGAIPTDRVVDLRFGEEAPIEAAFDVADGDGRVAFVVSPRMTMN